LSLQDLLAAVQVLDELGDAAGVIELGAFLCFGSPVLEQRCARR